jgi:integrase
MTRRGAGEGSIFQNRKGGWTARYVLPSGKRREFSEPTRAKVAHRLALELRELAAGELPAMDRLTVKDFLQLWLTSSKPTVRLNTWTRYEQYVRVHIVPRIGRVALARLEPEHLEGMYGDIAQIRAPRTVHHVHTVMHTALGWGVERRRVARNVADLVRGPKVPRREMLTFSLEEAMRFTEAIRGDRFEALYLVAITTGMREDELLSLRWRNVDLSAGRFHLQVTKSPKGREVALIEPAVAALAEHRRRQLAERLRVVRWHDNDLVFPNRVGNKENTSNLRLRDYYPLLRRAGLPRIRFHDLRHSAATLLMGLDVNAKVVADLLGHADASITLDIYSHVQPPIHREAIERLQRALFGR